MIDETPYTPITEETLERQGWSKVEERERESEKDDWINYHYYTLPIPKDNPDKNAFHFVSSATDDYKDLGIKKGEYAIEIDNTFGLGICFSEEELIILYKALTKQEIETDID